MCFFVFFKYHQLYPAKQSNNTKCKSNAYFNKGLLFIELKKFKKAIECFNKSIQLNPNDSLDARRLKYETERSSKSYYFPNVIYFIISIILYHVFIICYNYKFYMNTWILLFTETYCRDLILSYLFQIFFLLLALHYVYVFFNYIYYYYLC
jgi:tetratricopeptide (TPR) repeat protein